MHVRFIRRNAIIVKRSNGDRLIKQSIRTWWIMILWGGGGWGVYRILGEIQSNTSVALSFRTLAVLAYRLLLITFHMSVSAGETAGSGSAVLDRRV